MYTVNTSSSCCFVVSCLFFSWSHKYSDGLEYNLKKKLVYQYPELLKFLVGLIF